ncbi:hypothetical protein KIPB_000965 [Kipferlia bialata]|uniref:Kinesin motor domain-containing protein n=1 Tax=Kipferlia bialata TaxID=797122 RepID=A0A9K3GF67_9EUKA|nr:hypothetical protein KIPB_000965 [Kipferlia bialata]|eukprot:g965.t1
MFFSPPPPPPRPSTSQDYQGSLYDLCAEDEQGRGASDPPVRLSVNSPQGVRFLQRDTYPGAIPALLPILRRRKISRTSDNTRSSRSHLVIRIMVTEMGADGREIEFCRVTLVDFAGCETEDTDSTDCVATEQCAEVNSFLDALGSVLSRRERGDSDIQGVRNMGRDSPLLGFLTADLEPAAGVTLLLHVQNDPAKYTQTRRVLERCAALQDACSSGCAAVETTLGRRRERNRPPMRPPLGRTVSTQSVGLSPIAFPAPDARSTALPETPCVNPLAKLALGLSPALARCLSVCTTPGTQGVAGGMVTIPVQEVEQIQRDMRRVWDEGYTAGMVEGGNVARAEVAKQCGQSMKEYEAEINAQHDVDVEGLQRDLRDRTLECERLRVQLQQARDGQETRHLSDALREQDHQLERLVKENQDLRRAKALSGEEEERGEDTECLREAGGVSAPHRVGETTVVIDGSGTEGEQLGLLSHLDDSISQGPLTQGSLLSRTVPPILDVGTTTGSPPTVAAMAQREGREREREAPTGSKGGLALSVPQQIATAHVDTKGRRRRTVQAKVEETGLTEDGGDTWLSPTLPQDTPSVEDTASECVSFLENGEETEGSKKRERESYVRRRQRLKRRSGTLSLPRTQLDQDENSESGKYVVYADWELSQREMPPTQPSAKRRSQGRSPTPVSARPLPLSTLTHVYGREREGELLGMCGHIHLVGVTEAEGVADELPGTPSRVTRPSGKPMARADYNTRVSKARRTMEGRTGMMRGAGGGGVRMVAEKRVNRGTLLTIIKGTLYVGDAVPARAGHTVIPLPNAAGTPNVSVEVPSGTMCGVKADGYNAVLMVVTLLGVPVLYLKAIRPLAPGETITVQGWDVPPQSPQGPVKQDMEEGESVLAQPVEGERERDAPRTKSQSQSQSSQRSASLEP